MAAAVFIPPSPHDLFSKMATSTRRAPLANIQNATNSPHRLLTHSGSKRSRAAADISQQENEHPQKRLAVAKHDAETATTTTTPRRQPQSTTAEGKVFERGNGESGSNAFQRRLVAARDRTANVRERVTKTADSNAKDVDTIRQWQKHYRKIFPSFSIYFDSVPDDLRARFVRHILHLGAKEEKFFSKTVTHIVTTRQIPPENAGPKSPQSVDSADAMAIDEQSQTINPSLLDRNNASRPVAVRRDAPMDILTRGRQMGMKIWAAEKLQRILTTITEDATTQAHQTRSQHAARTQEDLSQVLRNEKIGASAEREQVSMPRELVTFRGPFVYIHDMDEKFRPTMIREYPKVARRQDGEWPQFRSATVGKCPFVEDPTVKKEEQERAKQKALLLQQQQKEAQQLSRTRSGVTMADVKMDPPRRMSPRKVVQDARPTANIIPTQQATPIPAPKLERQSSFPPMPEQPPVNFVHPAQMHLAREPAASGIQRSNMTSAIQSQMISSTAGTGTKTSTSKEVHELKRKVLERGHTGSLSIGSIPSSHRMTDLVGALKNARAPAPERAAKSRAQAKLGGIQEENAYADDIEAERAAHAAARKKKVTKRDPKPGYCENCRDKYDDFEEHTVSRKHRKFAMTQSNWDELDALLRKLQEP